MQLPALQSAKLIRRYKRFLADIELPTGDVMTIHCANTGAMTGCGEKGDTIWYSHSDSQTRKYPHSWELTQLEMGNFAVSIRIVLISLSLKHCKISKSKNWQCMMKFILK